MAKFDAWIEQATDKQQYLKRMIRLSDPNSFSISASPRGLIRINWKIAFDQRARSDEFGDQMDLEQGVPHQNKIVREFLSSFSDASHLFFAKQIVSQLYSIDFEIDHHITFLARRLNKEEAHHEDI